MDFHIGDRIVVNPCGQSILNNLHGTIIMDDIPDYLINFDEENVEFHDDDNGNYEHHCLWVPNDRLSLEPLQFFESDFDNFMQGD